MLLTAVGAYPPLTIEFDDTRGKQLLGQPPY